VRPKGSEGTDRRSLGRAGESDTDRSTFYRHKAAECLRRAAAMLDEDERANWIEIANAWTQLAQHAARQSQG
jgi:hypothetical protein